MEIIISVVGVLATLAGLYLGWRQLCLSGRQANKELRVKRPIDVLLYRSHAERAVWVLPWTKDEKHPVLVDLELALINHDEDSIENIMVQMEISSLCYAPELERGLGGDVQAVRMERFHDPVQGAEKTRVHYTVPFLHPEVAYVIRDDIFIPFPSRIIQEVKGKLRTISRWSPKQPSPSVGR